MAISIGVSMQLVACRLHIDADGKQGSKLKLIPTYTY
jgi:hypothetical protein